MKEEIHDLTKDMLKKMHHLYQMISPSVVVFEDYSGYIQDGNDKCVFDFANWEELMAHLGKSKMKEEHDKKEVYGVDDAIVNNGLSLEKFNKNNSEQFFIRKLALNGEFIPGQCAWNISERNKWGCRKVVVHFEVYDGDNDETDSGQLVNLK